MLHRAIAAALVLLFAGAAAAHEPLYLAGATLVDPDTGTTRRAGLLIVDGRIAGSPPAAPAGFAGRVLDLRGKWVLPGLRDFHVHAVVNQAPGRVVDRIGTLEALRRYLYAGVTGVLDLFNDENAVLALRDRQRAGGLGPAADLFAAGPCLTATGGHCTEYPTPTRIVDTPEDARREIGELAAKRPDVVKLVYEHVAPELAGKSWRPERPSLDVPTLEAAVAAAAAHGLPTVVHVRSWDDVRACVEAGATAVTHVPSHAPVPADLAARMAERGTRVIPTLAVGDPLLVAAGAPLADPLLRAVAGETVLAAYRGLDHGDERGRRLMAWMYAEQGVRAASLARLAAAGVPVVAGTDAGNPLTVHGWSLHRELELMVAAGLTPAQALAAATTAAGELMGRGWGLAPGDEGTVVVLDASPLADVRNTRRIHAVVHHGEVVDRAALLASAPPVRRAASAAP